MTDGTNGREWYFADNGEQKGPYPRRQIDLFIADGVVRPDTLVWAAGMDGWAEMRATELAGTAVPPPPPAPMAPRGESGRGTFAGDAGYTYSGGGADAAGGPGGPAPSMGFQEAVVTCLKQKYASFSGRGSRSEYWYFVLFNFLVNIVASVIDGIIVGVESNFAPVSTVIGLALIVPGIAAGVRRLHDTDRSGWWLLIVFIPLLGLIAMIYFLVQRGTEGRNRFG